MIVGEKEMAVEDDKEVSVEQKVVKDMLWRMTRRWLWS